MSQPQKVHAFRRGEHATAEPKPLHDGLAAALWPGEWAMAAGDEERRSRVRRRRLRQQAEEMLADACRLTSHVEERPTAAVSKPPNVSLATAADAFGLLVLIQESDQEQAFSTRDYGKVREVVDLASDRTPLLEADGTAFMRPIFGVIKVDGVMDGACGLFPTQPWDSWETYLRGFFLFVREKHRDKEPHAKNLLQWANWFADRSHMPVVWEALNSRTLDERSRLFLRHASPLGGLFIHRPVE